MQPLFWKALERIGTEGAAAADWRFLMGSEWDAAEPFLLRTHRTADTVIDPDRPTRRLTLYPEGESDFVAVADEPPLRTPLPLTQEAATVLAPDWTKIGGALGPALGFVAGDWSGTGQTRQIGILQAQRRVTRPVYLYLHAGTLGDAQCLLRDMAALPECALLVPSARWLSPQVVKAAGERGIQLEALAERFAQAPGNRGTLLARAADVQIPKVGASKRTALLDVQPDWSWDNLHMEVDLSGKITVRYGQQRGEYRFPKKSGRGYSQGIEILGRIAAKGFWENPPSGDPEHEKLRKAFRRLARDIRGLVPFPGEPFEQEGRQWTPLFHLKLTGVVAMLKHQRDLLDEEE